MAHNRYAVSLLAVLLLAATTACYFFPFFPPPERTRQPLLFAPDALPSARKGVAYNAEIKISQNETPVGEFYILEGTLPEGLSMSQVEHENVARITGVPMEVGKFIFSVAVWCYGTSINGQQGSREYTIEVGN
jgi:hypothetical protein